MTTKIKWLIAHEPEYLFTRTAKAFSDKLSVLTDGKFEIEILTEETYKQKYNSQHEKGFGSVMKYLNSDEIQMSQTQVHFFGEYDVNYRVFDMPFLFEDHDHASRVFEGPIGRAMNNRLYNRAGVQGLAFTYSGGYRVFGSNRPITNLSEMAGCVVRVNNNPVCADYVSALGADPVRLASYGYDEIEAGTVDAAETTYLRFKGKHILKSEHNLFLTTIVVSNKFWDSLDEITQEQFKQAAQEAARLERQWSLEDAVEFENKCLANGVEIYEVSEEDKALMKQAVGPIYEKWEQTFYPGLLNGIKKLAH